MKKLKKEIILFVFQFLLFYILPLFAGPTDTMGLVFLIIAGTLFISLLFGGLSCFRFKHLYPFVISLLFIPSVFIYYNDSAIIYSFWYFCISLVGLILGSFVRFLINLVIKKEE